MHFSLGLGISLACGTVKNVVIFINALLACSSPLVLISYANPHSVNTSHLMNVGHLCLPCEHGRIKGEKRKEMCICI